MIVVDNASADGTADAVRAATPRVDVLGLPANAGAVARTDGVRRATTPYVAFADDDSWWEPGALQRAATCSTPTPPGRGARRPGAAGARRVRRRCG
ncbi:hypothetical protein A7K94_0207135, partial [Modestobacter sp. VKM Ac-2676]